MRSLEVLIVDDEPIAQDILEEYINQIPGLHLAGKCRNAFEAQSLLAARPVDLMLLDINMPRISGIDLLRSLPHPPAVIFTTAYSEFAVQSYELNAVDYLLKPVSFERFFTAISKAMSLSKDVNAAAPIASGAGFPADNVMFVKANGKLVKIDLGKLWLVEGAKDYLKLYIDDEKLVVYNTMKNIEAQLAFLPSFMRISRSYIVNMRFATEIEGNSIKLKGQSFLIGPTYKDKVSSVLNTYRML